MKQFFHSAALSVVLFPVLFVSAGNAQSASPTVYGLQIEEFERRWGDQNERVNVWNADGFIGNDEIRLRWLSEGEYDDIANKLEKLENRFVAQIPVSKFFDVKGGVRLDRPKGENRNYGVVGLTGLAPQWFEIDADLFYSNKGKWSARFDAEYEVLITNRLILTPSADINYAFSDDTGIELKSGFSSLELGARLSYDLLDRMFSPYVGVVYESKLGNTADYLRSEGEDTKSWFGVVGLKMMF